MTPDEFENHRLALHSDRNLRPAREALAARDLTWPALYRLIGIASAVGLDESLPRAESIRRVKATDVRDPGRDGQRARYRLTIGAEQASKLASALDPESGGRFVAHDCRKVFLSIAVLLRQGAATLYLFASNESTDPAATPAELDTFAASGRRLFFRETK